MPRIIDGLICGISSLGDETGDDGTAFFNRASSVRTVRIDICRCAISSARVEFSDWRSEIATFLACSFLSKSSFVCCSSFCSSAIDVSCVKVCFLKLLTNVCFSFNCPSHESNLLCSSSETYSSSLNQAFHQTYTTIRIHAKMKILNFYLIFFTSYNQPFIFESSKFSKTCILL